MRVCSPPGPDRQQREMGGYRVSNIKTSSACSIQFVHSSALEMPRMASTAAVYRKKKCCVCFQTNMKEMLCKSEGNVILS